MVIKNRSIQNTWFRSLAITAVVFTAAAAVAQNRPLPRVLSAGADQTVRLFGPDGKETQNILAHDATVTAVITADGKTAYSASTDRSIKSWNIEDGAKSNTFEGHSQEVTCLALSPDGRVLASGSVDQSVRLWNTLTGMQTRRIPAHSKPVRALAWSPDGLSLASAGADKLIQVWRADGSPAGTIVSQDDAITSLVWTRDSASILTGDGEGNLKLWNARDFTVTGRHKAHEKSVTSVALRPDGDRIATAGADGRIKIWTYASRNFTLVKESPPGRTLNAVAWSVDGTMLLTAGADRAIRYWNAADLSEVRKINAHDAAVTAIVALSN